MITKENWAEFNATIGASRAPAVLGVSKWATPADVFDAMTSPPAEPPEPNDDMRRGIINEPLAIKEAKRQTRLKLVRHPGGLMYHTQYPHAHALPDAWVKNAPDEHCEVKCPRPATFQKMYLHGVPSDYMVQMQHQMAVLGTKRCHFVAYDVVTTHVLHVVVKRDDEFIGEMMEAERRFFDDLKAGRRPEVDAKPIEVIDTVGGALVTVDSPEAVNAAYAIAELQSLRDEAQDAYDQAKARLIEFAGDAQALQVMDGERPILRCYNKVMPGRETFDWKAFRAACSDEQWMFAKAYLKVGNSYKTFRAYKLGKD